MHLMLRAPLLGRNFGGRCGEVAGLLSMVVAADFTGAWRRLAPAVKRAVQKSDPRKGARFEPGHA